MQGISTKAGQSVRSEGKCVSIGPGGVGYTIHLGRENGGEQCKERLSRFQGHLEGQRRACSLTYRQVGATEGSREHCRVN